MGDSAAHSRFRDTMNRRPLYLDPDAVRGMINRQPATPFSRPATPSISFLSSEQGFRRTCGPFSSDPARAHARFAIAASAPTDGVAFEPRR